MRQLWRLEAALVAAPRNGAPHLYVETLNEMINMQTVRVAAINNRIPGTVLLLEVLGAAIAFSLLALYGHVAGRHHSRPRRRSCDAAPAGHVRPRSSDAGLIQVPDTPARRTTSMALPPAASGPWCNCRWPRQHDARAQKIVPANEASWEDLQTHARHARRSVQVPAVQDAAQGSWASVGREELAFRLHRADRVR